MELQNQLILTKEEEVQSKISEEAKEIETKETQINPVKETKKEIEKVKEVKEEVLTFKKFKDTLHLLASDYIYKFKKGKIISKEDAFLVDTIDKAKFFIECVFILKICYTRTDNNLMKEKIREELKKQESIDFEVIRLYNKFFNSVLGKEDYKDKLQDIFNKHNKKIEELFSLIISIIPRTKKEPDYSRIAGFGLDEVEEMEDLVSYQSDINENV